MSQILRNFFSLVLVAIVSGCATRTARVVEANEFILRDANGNKRATLAMTQRGPQLAMFSPEEDLLIRLEALDDSSHLVLHGRRPLGSWALAPVFLGVGDRGNQECGFLQLKADGTDASDVNCYFLLEPKKDVRGK